MKTEQEIKTMVLAIESELARMPDEDMCGESTAEQQQELLEIIDTLKNKGDNDDATAWLNGEDSDLASYE